MACVAELYIKIKSIFKKKKKTVPQSSKPSYRLCKPSPASSMLFPVGFGGPQTVWLIWKSNTTVMMPKEGSPLYCLQGPK